MNVYILDHTALLALGAGSRVLSKLVDGANRQAGLHLHVPAMCLAAAVAARPALADHVGMLVELEILDLDYPAASEVGRLIAGNADWSHAHAISSAHPAVDWPDGRTVITATPDVYARWAVRTIALA